MENSQYIIGRNAVIEALKSGRDIDSILIARGNRTGSVNVIIKKAGERGIAVKEVSPLKLESLCPGENAQGVAAVAASAGYVSLETLFENAQKRGEPPFFVIADEIEDPHNLGAIIRTADAAGVHGIIIPKHRAVGLTYAVGKASAGAVEYVPVAKVTNLSQCIDTLKERGVWIYGADMGGNNWRETDLKGPCAIVIGSEGFGISRLLKEKCDFLISLPMRGRINSLNASVAAGIILFEASAQRNEIGIKTGED